MRVDSHRDLIVWQKALDLVVNCYSFTRQFPKSEQFGLTSQLQRAAVSIPANIAEGHGRGATNAFLNYLSIANGSLKELETHMLIAQRLGYIRTTDSNKLLNDDNEVGRLLTGLRRSLSSKL